jgi:uracil-DNA glycosylase family 4
MFSSSIIKLNMARPIFNGAEGLNIRDKFEKLMDLNERIRNCKSCELWRTRNQVIIGEGKLNSKLMLIAQAPGYKEDKEGKMFVGPSGKKLNELLKYARIERREIYMTNLLKCILPHYRRPKNREIEACSGHLDEEMEIVNPRIITTLGYFPAKYVFDKYELRDNFNFKKICGKKFFVEDRIVLPLMHPAALLYKPEIEEKMKEDYEKLRKVLDGSVAF